MTDPGSVPAGWMPDVEGNRAMEVQEVKSDGGARFCSKCQAYKPPRCHHCRICKACVLRMDHHCVWIANCVGQHNYHPFFLFVLYFLLGCAYALYFIINQVLQDLNSLGYSMEGHEGAGVKERRKLSPSSYEFTRDSLFRIFTAVLVLPLLIALSVLFFWHVYLVLHNKTTIEYHEGVRARWLAKKRGQPYKHPYDLGIMRNIVTIFGPHATSWFWPTLQSPGGDGLSFQTYLRLSDEGGMSVGLQKEVQVAQARTGDDDYISLGHKP